MPHRPFKGFRNQNRGGMPPIPPATALDRFGHVVEPGHIVLFNSPEDLAFEAVDVTPLLNPGLPPGQRMMNVVLQARFPVTIMGAMPNRGLVIVGETEARIAAQVADNGAGRQEPPDQPAAPSGIVLTDAPAGTEPSEPEDPRMKDPIVRPAGDDEPPTD